MSGLVSKALGEKFTFTISNNTGATKVIALLAAFFSTLVLVEGAPNTFAYTNAAAIAAAGHTCDYVLDDGVIVAGLVATPGNSKKSIRAFREYIKTIGATCLNMNIRSNNVGTFNANIEVVSETPLSGAKTEYLDLNEFFSQDQSQTSKIVTKDLNLPMGPDTLMLMPIYDGHEVTITFQF